MGVYCALYGCLSSINDKTKRKFYRFPLDESSAEELLRKNAAFGEGEEGWGAQGSCSCGGQEGTSDFGSYGGSNAFGGHGVSSAIGGSEGCSCNSGRRASRGKDRFGGGSGFGGSSGIGSKGGLKTHKRNSRIGGRGGSSDNEGNDSARGRKGRNSIGDKDSRRGKGGPGAKGGDGGSVTEIGDEEGDGGSGIGGKRVSGGSEIATIGVGGAAGKTGLMQNIHSLFIKLYDYCGPVGLWNVVLAMLLLGYYGKSYYWDSAKGRGYSTGGGTHQFGGKKIKCPPKHQAAAKMNTGACCGSCTCSHRLRILKHRLKWPEEDRPCH